ncbi:antibiotic biosynthesis monooxygenase [Clostridium sp. SHJSY1]|uniref:putative quinol monooxygenase n=1 Tax=Clostridium sp. SHJSY1 TaxID=2942483 RepID=UPI002875B150|nr:putative quinol monooxygenase [Clostridium sp. SHJSY1]MDS0524275.1 antibiotic biosynthesis monooxygenase [Clostridium sp. SHJSY1]
MLKIVAKFIVNEDKVEEFKKHAEILAAETRKEEGCISYQLLQNVDNSEMLFFVEEWENQEAIDNHNKSKHFTELLPKLTENLKEDPAININKIVI